MEFEDYEDMFTFEEWSFSHLSSSGNDFKTFDELCDEVLRLSDACDKKVNLEFDSLSNERKVDRQCDEAMPIKSECVRRIESQFDNDTSSITPSEPSLINRQSQSQQQQHFAASGGEVATDSISMTIGKHADISPSSNFVTEMVNEENHKAQSVLECKQLPQKSEILIQQQEAVNTPISNSENSLTKTSLNSLYEASSDVITSPHTTTDVLPVSKIIGRECGIGISVPLLNEKLELKLPVPKDCSAEDIQTNSACSGDISVLKKVRKSVESKESIGVAQSIKTIPLGENKGIFTINNIISDENKIESQRTKSDFAIKDCSSKEEIENKSITPLSKGKKFDNYTVGLADSNDSVQSISVENIESQLSESATEIAESSISAIKPILPSQEIAKATNVTEVATNDFDSDEISRRLFTCPKIRNQYCNLSLGSDTFVRHITSKQNGEHATESSIQTDSKTPMTEITSISEAIKSVTSAEDYRFVKRERHEGRYSDYQNMKHAKEVKGTTEKGGFQISEQFWKADHMKQQTDEGMKRKTPCVENLRKKTFRRKNISTNEMESEGNNTQKQIQVRIKTSLQRIHNKNTNVHSASDAVLGISQESTPNIPTSRDSVRRKENVILERNPCHLNKNHSGMPRELARSNARGNIISIYCVQNVPQDKTTHDNSVKCTLTLNKSSSALKRHGYDAPTTSQENPTSGVQYSKNKSVSNSDIIASICNRRNLRVYPKKTNSNLSVCRNKTASNSAVKEETPIFKGDKKVQDTSDTGSWEERKINPSKEIVYLRTVSTISLVDQSIVMSENPSIEHIMNGNGQQVSSDKNEIKSNERLSGGCPTIPTIKNTCLLDVNGASAHVLTKSNTSRVKDTDGRVVISGRRRSAARVVPFSDVSKTAFNWSSVLSTRNESHPNKRVSVHKEKVGTPGNEPFFAPNRCNTAFENDDEIIIIEPEDQSESILPSVKIEESERIARDSKSTIIEHIVPLTERGRASTLDSPKLLTTATTRADPARSVYSVSGSNAQKRAAKPMDDASIPSRKKPKLERLDSSDYAVQKSLLRASISHNELRKMALMKSCPQKAVSLSKNLGSLPSKKSQQNLSISTTQITHENENRVEETTPVLACDENKNCSSNLENQVCENVKSQKPTSTESNATMKSTPVSLFDDETIKSIFASEKIESASPLSDRTRTVKTISGKSNNKTFRSPSKSSRIRILRRKTVDSQPDITSVSPKKTKAENARSPAKCLRKSPAKMTAKNTKSESEMKDSTPNAAISVGRNSDNCVKQQSSLLKSSSRTEDKGFALIQPQISTLAADENKDWTAAPTGNATNRETTTPNRSLRRLRRTSNPILDPSPASDLLSVQESAAAPATSGRSLRRRVRRPSLPAAAPSPPSV